jgi:hypothetical protein
VTDTLITSPNAARLGQVLTRCAALLAPADQAADHRLPYCLVFCRKSSADQSWILNVDRISSIDGA